MTAALASTDRIAITDSTIEEARRSPIPRGARLALRTAEGEEVPLRPEVEQLLLATLSSVADRGEVTIGRIPEHLTSTVAADMLGVSRPTLMKWAREGDIASFKVGTHTRFTREDVLRMRAVRSEERRAAFDRLRALDAAEADLFDE